MSEEERKDGGPEASEAPEEEEVVAPPEGLDPKSLVEAVLYMEDRPVGAERLAKIAGVPPAQVRRLVEELRREYEERKAGVRINEIAHGYILSTAPELGEHLRRFYSRRSAPPLSRAALEVLAIIAYKQPITRLEIEAIRGASVGDGVLRQLLERKLVRIAGRKEVVGHPLLYATTKEFLLYFGLKSLDALPTIKEIREMEIT